MSLWGHCQLNNNKKLQPALWFVRTVFFFSSGGGGVKMTDFFTQPPVLDFASFHFLSLTQRTMKLEMCLTSLYSFPIFCTFKIPYLFANFWNSYSLWNRIFSFLLYFLLYFLLLFLLFHPFFSKSLLMCLSFPPSSSSFSFSPFFSPSFHSSSYYH